MKPKLSALLACSLMILSSAHADTFQKVAESKKIVLGVRDSSPPLSYSVMPGKYIGYHVEICDRLVGALKTEMKLNRLNVEYTTVTSQNRIPLVQNGTVDLECGTTTNNATRQKDVSFAPTTYVTEIRIAKRKDSGIQSIVQLGAKTVVSTTGSTAVQALRRHKRAAILTFKEQYGKDHSEAFLLLETGRADAMLIDDNILAGQISLSKDPSAYQITGEVLAVEPIAIMYRKDDPVLKKFVDDQITSMAKSGELTALYDKWFTRPIPPRNSSVNLPMSASLKQLIAAPDDKPAEAYPQNAR